MLEMIYEPTHRPRNSSKVVRQSFAGQELLEKAKGLQEPWVKGCGKS